MIKLAIYLGALSLTLSMALAQSVAPPPSQRPPDVLTRQWQVKHNKKQAALSGTETPDRLSANVEYELHNARRQEQNLSSQVGQSGSGFGFTEAKAGYFIFRRPNERDHRAVTAAETLALYSTGFRRYKTAVGWAPLPIYEWQLHHQQGPKFALFNTKRKDYVILMAEGGGRNRWIGWLSKNSTEILE